MATDSQTHTTSPEIASDPDDASRVEAPSADVVVTETSVPNNKKLALRVWRMWMAHQKSRVVGALVLMALVAATTSIYPVLIQQTLDMANDRNADVFYVPLLVVGVVVIKSVSLYFQTVVTRNTMELVTTVWK
ncbi:MAG: hypothetical protein AAFY01_04330 [Pseudomonadota bacterium]